MLLRFVRHAPVGLHAALPDRLRDLGDLAAEQALQPGADAADESDRLYAVADHDLAGAQALEPEAIDLVARESGHDRHGHLRSGRKLRLKTARATTRECKLPAIRKPRQGVGEPGRPCLPWKQETGGSNPPALTKRRLSFRKPRSGCPESIITVRGYGFRARAFGAPRNDAASFVRAQIAPIANRRAILFTGAGHDRSEDFRRA